MIVACDSNSHEDLHELPLRFEFLVLSGLFSLTGFFEEANNYWDYRHGPVKRICPGILCMNFISFQRSALQCCNAYMFGVLGAAKRLGSDRSLRMLQEASILSLTKFNTVPGIPLVTLWRLRQDCLKFFSRSTLTFI
uniref:Uncharacterized protein n=1 Tax=Physcomitrium patens TaxID=3218 RepID=A0A2K1JYM5_PHYPA|nr:hypothetical protein PHYPA_013742 [Physcomitrium patens]